MRILAPIVTALFLILAPAAHAEDIATWDLRRTDFLPAGSNNLTTVTRVADGISVKTDTDGVLFWSLPIGNAADVLRITLLSPRPAGISLLWHPSSTGPGVQAEEPISIGGSEQLQEISIALTDNEYWDPTTTEIGIGIPAGADMVIESMAWHHYTVMEKIGEAWNSFWTFDGFHAYSINFLWGPLIAFNPTATYDLYAHLPPTAWSITRFMYGLLLCAFLGGIGISFFYSSHKKRVIAFCFWGTFLCIWLLFDGRMSLEQFYYVADDWRMYILPAEEQKTFRTNDNLQVIIRKFSPIIARYDRYVLRSPPAIRIYSNMRYETYPSVALQPDQDSTGVKLWVVIKDASVHVNEKQELVDANGTILAASGSVLATYDTTSFLYATP